MNNRPYSRHFALIKTGLIVLALFVSAFAAVPSGHAADSQQEALECEDGKTDQFTFKPADFPDNPEKVDPQSLSVTVGKVTFGFDSFKHHARDDGSDSWDFVFTPRDATDGLSFIYRQDPSSNGGFGYVINGPPGEGQEPTNEVCRLIDFHKSPIGEFLKDQTDAAGLTWAKKGGVTTDVETSDLLDRAANDPFAQAVQKLAEIITSLIGSVTAAIAWAIDAGTLMNNEGLGQAWTVVRDLVNVLFILVLVAMAFMSIIRIEPQKYNVRQLLPLLVFSIIAVNFSFLFANVMANTAAVLSQPFLEQAHVFIDKAAGVGSGYSDGLVEGFGESIVLLIASVVILISLLVLLFFLIVRIIVIWVLAVLSPVVFLFLVLPFTRGESRNLIKNWIQWVYMAPIAMLLLFVGSLMLNSALSGTDTGDPGGSAILQAIFFAGITIAAVMVPIGLGGRIAQMAARHGSRAGKLGGKGGVGALGLIPAGRGTTLGQRVREGKAFMDQRKKNLEQRASLSAANAQLQLAGGPLGSTLTGMDDSIRTSVQDKLIGDKEKEMMAHDISAKRRIAHGWQYGVGHDAEGAFALDNQGNNVGYLSPEEERLAQNRIAAGAAYKAIAGHDLSELYMLEQPGINGRTFAWTGAQQLHKGDPVIGSYDLGGKLNEQSMRFKSHHMNSDDVKGLDTSFLRRARDGDRVALDSLREIDEVRLANASNADHRMKFSNVDKMHLMNEIASEGLLSKSVNRAEFDNEAAYQAEVRKQEEKEEIVQTSYAVGQRRLKNPPGPPP